MTDRPKDFREQVTEQMAEAVAKARQEGIMDTVRFMAGFFTREDVGILREAAKRIEREGNPYVMFPKNLASIADRIEQLIGPDLASRVSG